MYPYIYVPQSIRSDSVSNHIHGNGKHYVTATSIVVDNLDALVLGILSLIFFIIYFWNYNYQSKSIVYCSLIYVVVMWGKKLEYSICIRISASLPFDYLF